VRTHWRFGAWSMIPNSSEAGHGPWPMGDGCSSVSAVPAAVGATRNTSTSDWSSCSRWLGTAVAWGKTVRPLKTLIPEAWHGHWCSLKYSTILPGAVEA